MANQLKPLVFEDTTFTAVDRNGQPWLRAVEIAKALGYANDNAISRIYARNAEEFTEEMSLRVNLTLNGFGNGVAEKQVRIFSLRGAHLIGMFAKTEPAKRFRSWVLDVLEGKASVPNQQLDLALDELDDTIDELGDIKDELDDTRLALYETTRQLCQTQSALLAELQAKLQPKPKRKVALPITAEELAVARLLKGQGLNGAEISRRLNRSTASISMLLRSSASA